MKNKTSKIFILLLFAASAAAFLYLNTCGIQMASSAEYVEPTSDMISTSSSLSDIRVIEHVIEAIHNVFSLR